MKGRKSDEPLKRITLRLYADDMDWLQRSFPKMGYNEVIRHIIRRYRRSVDSAVSAQVPNLKPSDLTKEIQRDG